MSYCFFGTTNEIFFSNYVSDWLFCVGMRLYVDLVSSQNTKTFVSSHIL